MAFSVGAGFVAGGGFSIIGAHTDSPVLKLKPCSQRSAKGYQQIDVEAVRRPEAWSPTPGLPTGCARTP